MKCRFAVKVKNKHNDIDVELCGNKNANPVMMRDLDTGGFRGVKNLCELHAHNHQALHSIMDTAEVLIKNGVDIDTAAKMVIKLGENNLK